MPAGFGAVLAGAAVTDGGAADGDDGAAGTSASIGDDSADGAAADVGGRFEHAANGISRAAMSSEKAVARRMGRRRWSTGTAHSIGTMAVRSWTVLVVAVVSLLTAACSPGGERPLAAAASAGAGASSPGAGSGGTPATSTPAADTSEPLPPALRQAMTGVSWQPGCPVGLDDLRLLTIAYVDFAGAGQRGQLVVHQAIAPAVLRVFAKLRAARFPIRSMQLIEAYGGSDDASMAADNTSAFNCRSVPGTSTLSNHAYGRAIDVNTVENPYLPKGKIMPPAGKDYLDRRDVRPGMIVDGDVVVTAFRAEGFTWGGAWRSGVDYQHFEKPK
ncbi:M15 family metallopeptidase [Dactylosporangium sp. NPDC005572]|uniref:M15 family metallopeptidase n=1 Tax=Dactylosporangium sp. NPDC005572 TaxID=3156889 RepID=UPI0033A9B04E